MNTVCNVTTTHALIIKTVKRNFYLLIWLDNKNKIIYISLFKHIITKSSNLNHNILLLPINFNFSSSKLHCEAYKSIKLTFPIYKLNNICNTLHLYLIQWFISILNAVSFPLYTNTCILQQRLLIAFIKLSILPF